MKKEQRAICTIALIVINIGLFLILTAVGGTQDTGLMLKYGAMYGPYVTEGRQYYRLLTSIFLHFGIEHLLNNVILLGALGWNLEMEIGKIRFLIVYLVSGVAGNLLSLLMSQAGNINYVSAGASGAIFGLMGGLVSVVIKNRGNVGRLTNKGLLFMVLLSLYFGFTSSGVDNTAHIGGLISGFILAGILYRRKVSRHVL